MVSPVGRTIGGGKEGDRDGLPLWLTAFVHANYFEPCSLHADSRRNERKMFCTDCTVDPFCIYCMAIDHEGHNVIQVRKSCKHEVVKASEIREYIDISGILTIFVHKAKVVFLNKRPPPPNPPKRVFNGCVVCRKTLQVPFQFCSIGCKLDVMNREDANLLFALRARNDETEDSSTRTESDMSSTPGKVWKMRHSGGFRIGESVPDQKVMDSHNPSSSSVNEANTDDAVTSLPTKPVFDHSNSRKRKGKPRRAPFF